MIDHVAIIGAGFSGTLQAVNLLRHDGPRATLIERAPVAGEGLAYGAAHPSHVLNVRASNMSAFPDEPDHFVRWLAANGVPDAATAFVPRITYGAYLRELLDRALHAAGDRLTLLRGDVVDVERIGDGHVRLLFADGRSLDADAAVLAVGNLPPHAPPGFDAATLPPDLYRGDPWAPGLADGLRADDVVLAVGTGLTMIDVILLLDARGFAGRIVAMSRRGLLPHRHAPADPFERIEDRPPHTASALVRAVRNRSAAVGWRNAVDELRPFTQMMWRAAGEEQRARFLRHLRPWWDIHRHRLAPQVAERLAAMRASGQLTVIAGKTLAARAVDDGIELAWRPRGGDARQHLVFQRVINCTGPQGDLARTSEPLLRRLIDRGAIRPDSARIGIEVDAEAQTVAADGSRNDWLFALGPMTRGAFWEIVAVPDIRAQTWTLARRLSNAHWVGGEGL